MKLSTLFLITSITASASAYPTARDTLWSVTDPTAKQSETPKSERLLSDLQAEVIKELNEGGALFIGALRGLGQAQGLERRGSYLSDLEAGVINDMNQAGAAFINILQGIAQAQGLVRRGSSLSDLEAGVIKAMNQAGAAFIDILQGIAQAQEVGGTGA